ncbi:MAG TPA: FAD-dependent oxidoreductase [Pseudomonadales bacterium]|nr:FAD-dependent oxidoreductase [Pseudomonadales bacterium]
MKIRPRLVVIGNGMAGMKTVEELVKLVPGHYDICVIGSEPFGNYNRIMLSPVLTGEKTIPEIMIHDFSWYEKHNIELICGHTAESVDRRKRLVKIDDGREIKYDKLLLATGSVPFIVPVPGHTLPDVVTFRDIQDVHRLLKECETHKKVAVIGGGLLGLEAANGLLKQGMDVTVIHDMPHLMNRQLDPVASDLLKLSLEKRGMKFRLATLTSEICAAPDSGKLSHLKFKDGSELEADLCVMAVGIRPNVKLAQSIGLQVARGILVNDTLQTFDPAIYAVGECVQHRGDLFGMVAPLYDQAKVCANHLAGLGFARFQKAPLATTLKVSGINLFSAGDFTDAEGTESIVLRDTARGVYRKLTIKDNKLIGSVMFGDTRDGNWYFDLINSGEDISQIRHQLMFGQRNAA